MRPRRKATIGVRQAPPRVAGARKSSVPWAELVATGLVGVAVGVALIIGSRHFGQEASAHVSSRLAFSPIAAPISALHGKEDPLTSPVMLHRAYAEADVVFYTQTVARTGKGDMMTTPALEDAPTLARAEPDGQPLVRPRARPQVRKVRILRTPPVWKLEKNWRLARAQRARILAERKKRLRERMCLAKALYFEARGEGIKGQLAVAQVILNRVRDPRFPNTVCGVVYQGAERRNACQFSFACDGKPDYPTNARQWAIARRLAAKALQGKVKVRGMEGVAFYHADYVRPQWASMMRPVIKIGRHIFYRDS